ncbi:MAG: MFS transporter, partial [Clostridia bacterium]|nr:MFS transporter [Clostridia bacterium]
MTLTYRHTRNACFTGYVVQAIINNLPPLLFFTFQQMYHVSLTQISLLITLNFAVQMGVDLLSAPVIDKVGYRVSIVTAHVVSVAGLICLALLPRVMSPYPGLIIAMVLNAIGGGLLEVLVSPLIEALPSQRKEQEMSLLHSFYCWGHVAVVLLTTGYFLLIGGSRWQYLPLLWAVVPLVNTFVFLRAPLCTLGGGERAMGIGRLIRMPLFWLLF